MSRSICICAFFQEYFDNIDVPFKGSSSKSGITVLCRGVYVSAFFKKKFDNFSVTF